MLNDLAPHVVRIRSNQSRTVPTQPIILIIAIYSKFFRGFVMEQVIYVGGLAADWCNLLTVELFSGLASRRR